jgi:oligopeptide transport system ATP-binding protein
MLGEGPPLVSVQDIRKSFRTKHGSLTAVDGVTFSIGAGETLAVVGESGCGKSTLAMLLLGLASADSGTIALDGERLGSTARTTRRRSSRAFSVVFQNPHSSLNPRMKVRAIVAEPLTTAFRLRGTALSDQVGGLLKEVGLGPEYMNRYPHELSGGQMQRVAIARALALQPALLILDEPTAALDVSVRAQILKLLKILQQRLGTSYLYITHDLGTVGYMADRIIVMYLGRIVESGSVATVFASPKHPYTRALLEAVPTIDPTKRGRFVTLDGEVPSPINRPRGCGFAPRCRWRSDLCLELDPPLTAASGDRAYACHHPLSSRTDGGNDGS